MNLIVKDRIRRKATELFALYGIRNTSVSLIADSLNMSKRTFYQLFSGKDELARDCACIRMRKEIRLLKEKAGKQNPLQALLDIGYSVYGFIDSVKPILWYEMRSNQDMQELMQQEYCMPLHALSRECFLKAQREGLVNDIADFEMTFVFFKELLQTVMANSCDSNRESLYHHAMMTYLKGLWQELLNLLTE